MLAQDADLLLCYTVAVTSLLCPGTDLITAYCHGTGSALWGPRHRDVQTQPRTGQKYATSSSTSSKRSR
jgi:hypothetical protein